MKLPYKFLQLVEYSNWFAFIRFCSLVNRARKVMITMERVVILIGNILEVTRLFFFEYGSQTIRLTAHRCVHPSSGFHKGKCFACFIFFNVKLFGAVPIVIFAKH